MYKYSNDDNDYVGQCRQGERKRERKKEGEKEGASLGMLLEKVEEETFILLLYFY